MSVNFMLDISTVRHFQCPPTATQDSTVVQYSTVHSASYMIQTNLRQCNVKTYLRLGACLCNISQLEQLWYVVMLCVEPVIDIGHTLLKVPPARLNHRQRRHSTVDVSCQRVIAFNRVRQRVSDVWHGRRLTTFVDVVDSRTTIVSIGLQPLNSYMSSQLCTKLT